MQPARTTTTHASANRHGDAAGENHHDPRPRETATGMPPAIRATTRRGGTGKREPQGAGTSAGQYCARRSAARDASGCGSTCGGAGGLSAPTTSSVSTTPRDSAPSS
jgi:hypothetical protein